METSYINTCLLNDNYKSLLSHGRTYAAFNDTSEYSNELTPKKCAQTLANNGIKELLDPMAGYGTIMKYGQEFQFNSYMVELNLPAHLWQILVDKSRSDIILKLVEELIQCKNCWPKVSIIAEISNTWFGTYGKSILYYFYDTLLSLAGKYYSHNIDIEKIVLSILLPFCMRLSTAQKGDAMHIKSGGVAIISGYDEDFSYYLTNLLTPLIKRSEEEIKQNSFSSMPSNSIIYGDASVFKFPSKHFNGMLTSPPYPNGVDYRKMFIVENSFIELLIESDKFHVKLIDSPIIGTNIISGRPNPNIQSQIAENFLSELAVTKLNKDAQYDMQMYYLPYLRNYFADMANAYKNISLSLADDFMGFIVVTNNAIRKKEIPVANFIVDIWCNHLNFHATIIRDKEISHIGAKNPHSKGRMARHTEYIIKVWRGCCGNISCAS